MTFRQQLCTAILYVAAQMALFAQGTNCSSISGSVSLNTVASGFCAPNTTTHSSITYKYDAQAACVYIMGCTIPYAANNGGPTSGGSAFTATGQCGTLDLSGQQIPGAVDCPPIIYSLTTSNAVSTPGTNYFIANGQSFTQSSSSTSCVAGSVSGSYQASCTALQCGSQTCPGQGGGGGGGCEEEGDSCSSDDDCCNGNCDSGNCENLDPIVIDLTGVGYQLTSVADGVNFDFYGTGNPILLSWTAAGWKGGFLALDRNGNGKIDNARELFSNITPQSDPPGKGANGFLALAAYDLPANGGNGDGWIDEHDAIFVKLVIWIDSNHNGVSDPGELVSLPNAGVQAISLGYSLSNWKDSFGNLFRYSSQSQTNFSQDQVIYDVLLQKAGRLQRFSTPTTGFVSMEAK